MDAKVAACLRYRYPALPDELHRLDLELSTELPSLHDLLPNRWSPDMTKSRKKFDAAFKAKIALEALR